MPLSDIQIRNLKPREKSYKVSDFEGLFVLVKVNGSKLWQFKYRMDGKERLYSIGVYPDVSLAQARKAKEAARANVAAGIDPSEAKQDEKRSRLEAKEQDRRGLFVQTAQRGEIVGDIVEDRVSPQVGQSRLWPQANQ
jgi:hypothetical protein